MERFEFYYYFIIGHDAYVLPYVDCAQARAEVQRRSRISGRQGKGKNKNIFKFTQKMKILQINQSNHNKTRIIMNSNLLKWHLFYSSIILII